MVLHAAPVRASMCVRRGAEARCKVMGHETPTAAESAVCQRDGQSQKTIATLVYALQAASFFVGITSIVGVIVNYVKLDDVRGTWLESHFRWQIRTFWFSLLWSIVGAITVYILIGWAILAALFVWMIYRIVKGWLRLNDGRAMYISDGAGG